MITQNELKELLHYDELTGEFTWLVSSAKRIKIGDRAGCINKTTGYCQININGKKYMGHRLAWLYYHGYFPTDGTDHINGIKNDNRLCNLREATQAENAQNRSKKNNNTSGFTGVSFHKPTGKWMARIYKDNKQIFLGYYDTPELAGNTHLKAKSELHSFQPVPR